MIDGLEVGQVCNLPKISVAEVAEAFVCFARPTKLSASSAISRLLDRQPARLGERIDGQAVTWLRNFVKIEWPKFGQFGRLSLIRRLFSRLDFLGSSVKINYQ